MHQDSILETPYGGSTFPFHSASWRRSHYSWFTARKPRWRDAAVWPRTGGWRQHSALSTLGPQGPSAVSSGTGSSRKGSWLEGPHLAGGVWGVWGVQLMSLWSQKPPLRNGLAFYWDSAPGHMNTVFRVMWTHIPPWFFWVRISLSRTLVGFCLIFVTFVCWWWQRMYHPQLAGIVFLLPLCGSWD